MNVAEIENLTVRYGNFTAVSNFSVEVPAGTVGLLGPNGAGKTTFLKTILGFIDPAEGQGQVLGYDIRTQGRKIRQFIGYMPEQDCHLPGISAVQYLAHVAELVGLPANEALRRSHEVLEYTGLGEARYRPVDSYSTGMKQRIKFAQALVHGPKLLLLDEPTNGLDPRGREEMLDLIRDVQSESGINVLICSHLLPDIERTCEHAIVLMNGQLRTAGRIQELKSIENQPVDVQLHAENPQFVAAVERRGLQLLAWDRTQFRLQGSGLVENSSREIFAAAREVGAQVRRFRVAERSLEDAFMEAMHE